MRNPDALEAYYQRNEAHGCLFGDRAERYLSLVSKLRGQNPNFLTRPNPIILQAGFFSSSVVDFRKFSQMIAPEGQVFHLDRRKNAFSLGLACRGNMVMADLTNLPFEEGTVDLMVMDLVTDYISNGELQRVAHEADRVLSAEGVILGSLLPEQKIRLSSEQEKVQGLLYAREYGELCRLLKGFKPVFLDETRHLSIDLFAYAKNKSAFPRVLVTKRIYQRDDWRSIHSYLR